MVIVLATACSKVVDVEPLVPTSVPLAPVQQTAPTITLNADTFNAKQDEPLVIGAPGVLKNDVPSLSGLAKPVIESDPLNGTVTLNEDGSFTYTPKRGSLGAIRSGTR